VRHVIVYLIDTLRADALIDPELGLPNLQRLLRGGLWAVDAWAPSSWTKASCASLLTSREPSRHGAVGRDSRLRRDVLSLGLWLERHGIAAQGLVANGNVAAEFGFAQGFRGWRHVYAPAPAVHEAALQALQEARTQRSFTYVHVVDPHDPYEPAEPWSHLAEPELYTGPLDGQSPTLERLRQGELTAGETDRRHLAALYRAEARQLDAAFGELLDGLERLGLRQSTAVVLASDHGEAFGEHGTWLHGDNLEPEQAQVLLGVHRPGPGGGRLEARLASLYDVAPTVCELLGVPAPPEIRGRSLLGPPTQGPVLLELDLDGVERVGLVGPDWAYSFSPGVNHEPRLYARLADPGQRRDLAAALPVAAEALEQWAEALRPAEAARSPAEPVRIEELSPETREQLRAMGYLGE
jgi:arylsulfatase A-like enzyme